VGSSTGTTGLDGHLVCSLDTKKLMYCSRTRRADHSDGASIGGGAADAAGEDEDEDDAEEESRMAAAGKTLASR